MTAASSKRRRRLNCSICGKAVGLRGKRFYRLADVMRCRSNDHGDIVAEYGRVESAQLIGPCCKDQPIEAVLIKAEVLA